MTICEAVAALRVGVARIERRLKRADLPSVEVDYATRILRRDVEAFIETYREGVA